MKGMNRETRRGSRERHKDKRKNNAEIRSAWLACPPVYLTASCLLLLSLLLCYCYLLYRPMALIIDVCMCRPTSSPFFLFPSPVYAPMPMVDTYPCSVPEFVARSQDRGTAR